MKHLIRKILLETVKDGRLSVMIVDGLGTFLLVVMTYIRVTSVVMITHQNLNLI
jgi:hypothetical protein